MSKNLILNKAFSPLATISDVKGAIATVTDVAAISDLRKRVEAARKYDSQTSERRNYWGELAIWSERRIGELLIESKADGTIGGAGRPRQETNTVTLTELLGTETESQADYINRRSSRLASHSVEAVEEAIESILQAIQAAGYSVGLVGQVMERSSG